jgi:histidinol-phosphate aminotransferase
MKRPTPRSCVQSLAPYVPGRPIEEVEAQYGITGAVKLASNENPLGPSPMALAAARKALADVHRYPDSSGVALRRALSKRFGVSAGRIILGAGASELIDLAVRAYVDPGQEVIVPAGIFRMIPIAVGRSGGSLVTVPVKDDLKPDLPALRRRIGDDTKIVALANPNNPTGAYLTRAEMQEYFDGLPHHVLTVLDEAYFDFAEGAPDYPNGLDFLAAGHSVVVLRTFSKISGLAGLRIGYAFAPEDVCEALHKVREPFNTTSVAQAAAIAALDDDGHRERVRAHVVKERTFLAEALEKRGFPPRPSVANFLLVESGGLFAPVEPEFARRGVIVRPMGGWGFPNAFRLTVGTHEENERFLAVLDEVLAAKALPVPEPARAAPTA